MKNLTEIKLNLNDYFPNDTFENQIIKLTNVITDVEFEIKKWDTENYNFMEFHASNDGGILMHFDRDDNQFDVFVEANGNVLIENLQFGDPDFIYEGIISSFNKFN
jgi:hypothetical protein